MVGVGSEIYIKKDGHVLLGVVTAVTGDISYVLMGNGQKLMRVNNDWLKTTGVEYRAFALVHKRQMTLDGKLRGWRNILPREEWWFEDESED